MTSCAVFGCASNSNLSDPSTKHTFHPLPSSLLLRAQWDLALGPLPDDSHVCSRHFDDSMFSNNEGMKKLTPNAVPKPFLESSLLDEPSCNLRECEVGSGEELVACRVCLAADGRLYPISGSGLEDTLAALAGEALPVEASPRHLCAWCLSRLSRCAAFRASCRRATVLLQTLLERGPLTIRVINAHNHKLQQQTGKLACSKVFQFGTDSFIETMPLIKTENNDNSLEAKCPEIEYLDSDSFVKKYSNDTSICAKKIPEKRDRPKRNVKSRTKSIECVKVEIGNDNDNDDSELDGCESDVNDISDIDTDTSDETLAAVKKRKRIKVAPVKSNTAKKTKKHDVVEAKDIDTINVDINEETRKRVGITTEDIQPVVEKNNRNIKAVSAEERKRKIEKRKANKSVYSCDLCEKEYKNESNLRMHKSRHDPNISKETLATMKKDAELDFEKKYNFDIKLLSKEEQKMRIEERLKSRSTYSCDVCGKDHNKESTLTAHKTTYHDASLPVECDVCFYRFRSRQELRKHQLEDRHRAIFTCRECGHVTRNRTYAKDHCLMHRGKTFACPHCEMKYDRQSSYYGHMRTQHPAENEACDQCGETFAGRVGLLVHKRLRHKGSNQSNEEFKCKDCDVKFLSADALRRHSELVADVPHAAQWPCVTCGESCGSENALETHAAEHQSNQHYCKECDKTFRDAASFALHVDRKHRNRRAAGAVRVRRARIVCEICGKVFMCLATLQYHMNGHLGLRPYQCPRCPKAFAHKTKLKMHMRVHTGEKPYQCEQCPLAFSARGNFTRHMKNVHLRVQVECDTCGKTMGAGSLAAHVRAVHRNQPYGRRKRDRPGKHVRVPES